MAEPIISFSNVCKSFGSKQVFSNLDLEVRRGETLTIIGGSGTGKSVLLKMLVGLMSPDSGSIVTFGQELVGLNERQLIPIRRRIAMLFQGAALFDSMTVGENIKYPLVEHRWGNAAQMDDRVDEVLEMVGVPGAQDLYPQELSGGMRKRIGLARAIAIKPEVILYDEPTTGLDPINVRRINGLIISLQERLGVTSIVVTHDMDSVVTVTDRLALVYEHAIGFIGSPEEARVAPLRYLREFMAGGRGVLEEEFEDGADPEAMDLSMVVKEHEEQPHESPEPEGRESTSVVMVRDDSDPTAS